MIRNKMFQEEEKILLINYLREHYLPSLFDKNIKDTQRYNIGAPIELIIRPQCNQKCEYCYIHKYGDKLYPLETRVSNEKLLNNIKILFNTLEHYHILIPEWDLFAGDLFYDNLIYQIFDLFIDYGTRNHHVISRLLPEGITITIPTNGYFLTKKEHQDQLIKYRELLENLSIHLLFSISTDGKFTLESREKTIDNIDQYYDELFNFASLFNCGFHPMIAPENIANQSENLAWWKEKCFEHRIFSGKLNQVPPFFEVRNGNWTRETIEQYKNFLKELFLIRFNENGQSIKKMARYIFIGDGAEGSLKADFYDPLRLVSYYNDNFFPCNLESYLRINLSNLSLPVCHRLTYPQFIAGNFICSEKEIIDFESNNAGSWITYKNLSPLFLPRCENCDDRFFCLKGCLGAQYEDSGEILLPIPTVCDLMKEKNTQIIELYYTSGILNVALTEGYITSPNMLKYIENKLAQMGYTLCQ